MILVSKKLLGIACVPLFEVTNKGFESFFNESKFRELETDFMNILNWLIASN